MISSKEDPQAEDLKCDCSEVGKTYNPKTLECEDTFSKDFDKILKEFKNKAEEIKKKQCKKQCDPNAG